jgi:hypothetical protein
VANADERLRGGEGGIRTPDTVTRMPHFECGAFNHSATSPWQSMTYVSFSALAKSFHRGSAVRPG